MPQKKPTKAKPMRERVRFLLGDELREIEQIDPTMTVLDYLRLVERRVGTKEGCNEGDCGACTVAIGRLRDGRVHYQAVNACIQFVGMLDGCQLLTVEDLKGADGKPHPIQAAMVDCHAAQCGFCTPGFVMSLFALYHGEAAPDEQRIDDALAGNLCRCTGYTPIVAAAKRMYEIGRGAPDRFAADRSDIVEKLEALADDQTVCVGADGRHFFAPATADALAQLLLDHPNAGVVAGATDVGLWVTKQMRLLEPVVYIGRVMDLRRIVDSGDALAIGAGVTYSDAMAQLAALYPDIGELFRRLGGEQVRNVSTIGGNIANGSPIGDSPPALMAARRPLGAAPWRRASGTGARRFFPRLRQAGPTTVGVRRDDHPAKARARPPLQSIQNLQALRSGHLGGDGRLRAQAHRRQGR